MKMQPKSPEILPNLHNSNPIIREIKAVARILAWGSKITGRGQARPERPKAGKGFLGRGSQPPLYQLRAGVWDSGRAVSSSIGVRGGTATAKRFLAFCGRYMALPGISVASGHVQFTKYFKAIHYVSAYPELLL